jgi:hypothetical protein
MIRAGLMIGVAATALLASEGPISAQEVLKLVRYWPGPSSDESPQRRNQPR